MLEWCEPEMGAHYVNTKHGCFEVGVVGPTWGVTIPGGAWLTTRYNTEKEAKCAAQGIVDYLNIN